MICSICARLASPDARVPPNAARGGRFHSMSPVRPFRLSCSRLRREIVMILLSHSSLKKLTCPFGRCIQFLALLILPIRNKPILLRV